jgi:hypothetical protein
MGARFLFGLWLSTVTTAEGGAGQQHFKTARGMLGALVQQVDEFLS